MTRMMSTLQALVWGGTIGFVAGLLTAKKPGAQLRQELSDNSASFCKECGNSINKMKAGASTQMRAIADESSSVRENLRSALSQINEQAATMKDTVLDTAQKMAEQSSSMKNKLAEQSTALKDTVVEQAASIKNTMNQEMQNNRTVTGSPPYAGHTFDVSPGATAPSSNQ